MIVGGRMYPMIVAPRDETSVTHGGELGVLRIGQVEDDSPIAERFCAIFWGKGYDCVNQLLDNDRV